MVKCASLCAVHFLRSSAWKAPCRMVDRSTLLSSRTSRKISGQADKLGEFELVWNEPASTKISAAHVQFVLLKNALLTDSLEIHVTQTSNEITIQF